MPLALLNPIVSQNSNPSSTDCPNLFVFDEPARVEVVKAPAESPANYLLKIPIAPIGKWKHAAYDTVSFSQSDFDQMLSNWQKGVVGYEPPLFLGHPTDATTIEGAPSLAFLSDLKQEGDTLYSYYEPVEPDLFEPAPSGGLKVKGKGVFRYSSAEIVRNGHSKDDGSNLGTLFVGMALTNRPFVPNLPFPEVVDRTVFANSDSTSVRVVFDSFDSLSPETMNTNPQTTAEGGASNEAPSFASLSNLILQQNTQITQLSEQLQQANSRIAQLEGDSVQRTVSSLNLPASLRETFSSILTDGNVSAERKGEILQQLQAYSQDQAAQMTNVQGDAAQATSSDTASGAAEPVNPYANIIAKNQRLAEQRAASQPQQNLV